MYEVLDSMRYISIERVLSKQVMLARLMRSLANLVGRHGLYLVGKGTLVERVAARYDPLLKHLIKRVNYAKYRAFNWFTFLSLGVQSLVRKCRSLDRFDVCEQQILGL